MSHPCDHDEELALDPELRELLQATRPEPPAGLSQALLARFDAAQTRRRRVLIAAVAGVVAAWLAASGALSLALLLQLPSLAWALSLALRQAVTLLTAVATAVEHVPYAGPAFLTATLVVVAVEAACVARALRWAVARA